MYAMTGKIDPMLPFEKTMLTSEKSPCKRVQGKEQAEVHHHTD